MSLFNLFKEKKPERTTGQHPLLNGETPKFVVDSDLLSDVGCVRTNNEDNGRIFRGNGHEPGDGRENQVLIVVADGMGGHNAGEVASAMAVETLEQNYDEMRSNPAERLKLSVEKANSKIYKDAMENADHAGMGTTCTALLLQGGNAYSAHVGDSRIYLLRGGGIYLMTEEHTQVMEMVKEGLIAYPEARHHPDKNVITRALGRQPKVDVSTWSEPLQVKAGDGFLICSDGLFDQIEDDELSAAIQPRSAASACEELVRLAKERGGTDNITVAIVRLLPVSRPAQMAVTRQVEVMQ